MTVTGCDIAWRKPTGAQLAGAGLHFASLYVGQDDTGKNMTAPLVADYAAHGVWTITNFEYGAQQMLGGKKQGVIDAALGWEQAKACGMPAGRPIVYSADWAATASQISGSILPYLVAARSVTGPGTVGVYGSYDVVTAVAAYWAAHFPGERIYLWQTVAWSKSRWHTPSEVRQTGGTVTVGGIALDLDYADTDDYGQWQPGRLPEILEADMPLTDDDVNRVAQATSALLRNTGLGEQNLDGSQVGGGHEMSVGEMVAQTHARQVDLDTKLDGLTASVAKLMPAAPVDVKALAAAVVSGLTPVVQQATAAGVAPDYDRMALVVEQHLAATLTQAK